VTNCQAGVQPIVVVDATKIKFIVNVKISQIYMYNYQVCRYASVRVVIIADAFYAKKIS